MKKKTNNNTGPVSSIPNVFRASKREKLRALVIVAAFLVSYALLLTFTPFSFRYTDINLNRYRQGDRADKDIIVAEDIIFIDKEATEVKLQAEQRLVPPVFKVSDEISDTIFENFTSLRNIFTENRFSRDSIETVYLEVQSIMPSEYAAADIQFLTSYSEIHEVFPPAARVLEEVLFRGIVNSEVLKDMQIPGEIEIWRWRDGRYEKSIITRNDIITVKNIEEAVRNICNEMETPEQYINYIRLLVANSIKVNAFYDEEETVLKQERVAKEINPVQRKLSAGELIVRKGEIITEEIRDKINVLTGNSKRLNIYSLLGTGLLLLLVIIISLFLFRPPLTAIRLNNTQLFILLFMYVLFIISAFIIHRTVEISDWIPLAVLLPTAFFSLLISVIINTRISLYFVLIVSITTLLITGLDPRSFLFAFFSGVLANILIKNAEKRFELVRGIFILSALNGIVMIMLGTLNKIGPRVLPAAFGWGVANGFASGIINLGVLPLFEQWLNIPTRFRLLELSDTNNPILKKMLSIAPGTYSHSLNVANMAEAACKEIGANPLLARVGAYYHDIGKIEQAEYFIENQKEANKLIDLNPSLSVSVIKSHVKIGIEKAKELKLPKAVVEIISQHHGSGLINYFYAEAVKNEKNSKINREDYSYSEPIPTSREAAVVMLADTVEAAVRTLKKPTVPKISKYVWDLFMYKIREQQLNNSELTLKDLETIRNVFVHILAGYFHARIEYPQTDGNEN